MLQHPAVPGDIGEHVGGVTLVGVDPHRVDAPGEARLGRDHSPQEVLGEDVVGVGLAGGHEVAVRRQAADRHPRLRIDRVHGVGREAVHVRIERRIGLRAEERLVVFLVPDLVLGDRPVRQLRVEGPEPAAAPVALRRRGDHRGVVGRIAGRQHLALGPQALRQRRGILRPDRRRHHVHVPGEAVACQRLYPGVGRRPVVHVRAEHRRSRLHLGPGHRRPHPPHAGLLEAAQLRLELRLLVGRPKRQRPELLAVDPEEVGRGSLHEGAGRGRRGQPEYEGEERCERHGPHPARASAE